MARSSARIRTTLVVPGAVLLGAVAALAALTIAGSGELRAVALPLLAMTGCAVLLVLILANRDGAVPIDDIGLWVVGVTWLYAVLPPLTYILFDYQFTPLTETRVPHTPAMTGLVGYVAWLYVIFAGSFVAAYLAARRRVQPLPDRIAVPPRSTVIAVVALLLLSMLVMRAINVFYNLSASDYVEAYLVVQNLPRVVGQVFNVGNGIRFILTLGVLVLLFADWRRWWPVVVLWIGWSLVNAFLVLGSRTALMVMLAASTVLYSRMVHRIGAGTALLLSAGVLSLFMVLGVLRAIESVADGGPVFMATPAEFEIVFMNAVDLLARKSDGTLGAIPLGVRLNDFVGFVPSQLLPFEKMDPANWLVSFYPALQQAGGGMAFGSVTQAATGFGAIEAIARGAVLGLICGVLFRYYRQHATSYWVTVAYLWVLILSYQPVRANTLIMFNVGLNQVVPTVILVGGLAWVLRNALRPQPEPGPAVVRGQ